MPSTLERQLEKSVDNEQPKYRLLADQLREQIQSRELRPGDRLPSFSEMRSHFGVTSTTVERVYGLLEQEGLIERQPRRGLFVAQPKRVLTGNIGIIGSSGFRAQQEPFYTHLSYGVQQAATHHRRHLLLLETAPGWDATGFIKTVDGLLLSGHPSQANREIVRLKPLDMPCVSLFVVSEGMTSVIADDYGAAVIAVRHLQEFGHRRIACLMATVPDKSQVQRGRFEGYSDALREAGGISEVRWMRVVPGPQQSFLEWGREQMRLWLQDGWRETGCTAIVVQNDQAAIGVMQALREAKIDVPGDVSVMGFDGTELCDHATPRLTSVQMPLEQMGTKAMDLLVEQIESGRAEEQTIVLPARLRAGDSVAPV